MEFSFELISKDSKSHARCGVIHTLHGDIQTPAFSPVATKATLRSLDPEDIKKTNSQVVLGNTYHLYLQPGSRVIEQFGGFGPFMGWTGPTVTDSGGYQISFLWQSEKNRKLKIQDQSEEVGGILKITDEGAFFRSHIDGSDHVLTPEKSIEIQKILGADIIMALDQPMGDTFTARQNTLAYERTVKWEERSFAHWKKIKSQQALFGIIQGGLDKKLRVKFLRFLVEMGFPGLAIGGKTIGSDPKITACALDTIADLLPPDKPLHALGLGGGPEGIFEAVQRGVDIFDNSSVTRMARTGLLFIYPEDGGSLQTKFRIDVARSKLKNKKEPVSKVCKCYTCQNFSTAYVTHLFASHEILAQRLASIHNVTFINNLMTQIRDAIHNNDFLVLKAHWCT